MALRGLLARLARLDSQNPSYNSGVNQSGPKREGRPSQSSAANPNPAQRAAQNIQDNFLNQLRRERTLVAIFLVSGVKLSGRIKSFDRYSLVLESDAQEQLIFKHAIASIVAGRASGESGSQQ